VFQNNCGKCHGKSAGGRFMAGPSLVSEKVTSAAADGLRDVITNGKGRMPKFSGKLSPAEIDTLVQQIKSAGKK
jgi:mono/diheme cytochrome c family protein